MKLAFSLFSLLFSLVAMSQELYTATEPASNRAVGSLGVRVDNSIMDEVNSSKTNYHLIPDLMFGISKTVMVSGGVFFSNRSQSFESEGGTLYAKYRFLSKDAVQKHFRMALFGRLSFNNSDVHQEEINMYGHNSGVEVGTVATQLLRKVALSSSLSLVKAADNGNNNKFVYGSKQSKAVNYTFSVGRLMLPKEYKNYKQTNFNVMLEFLSQYNPGSGKYYLDAAPSLQLIFNSQGRLDIGYRKELTSSLIRTAPNGFFVRIEYNLFNVF
ncbi:hypothetical protein [Flavisolibacter tropicus]|uniref:Outer membrane protein beta-barrel domain-containing protein n=1 Tax=Flavisolibacter tropicus TaxID=1492898 RepID=A0A172U1E5_9BACT|nr:hypothetical protein [Flavisolibacter tropicus]ANE53076.1 hypothetical protein SY85_23980 [Flavisolibacter tropicus]